MKHARFLPALLLSAASAAPGSARAADALSVTFDLAGLPTSITLCRYPGIAQFSPTDEQWNVAVDVDNDASTGAPQLGGADVILTTHTLVQESPCTPTIANTADSLVVDVLAWSADQNTFLPISAATTVATDFSAHWITVSADLDGPLSGLNAASRFLVTTASAYPPTMGLPTIAHDDGVGTNWFALDAPVTLPAGDVQGCSAPCGPSADWYPLIDLIGSVASIGTGDAIFSDGFESPPSTIAD